MAVYTYGTTGDYANPQDAFDACQAANEDVDDNPQPFAEPNYIRAVDSAAYGDVQMVNSDTGRGVIPTKINRLIWDTASGVNVVFDSLHGVDAAPSFTTIYGLEIMNGLTSQDRWELTTLKDWLVARCKIGFISFVNMHGPIVENCFITGANPAEPSWAINLIGIHGNAFLRNNAIMAPNGYGIYTPGVEYYGDLILIHNTIYAHSDAVYMGVGVERDTGHIMASNNIFYSLLGNCITYAGDFGLRFPLGEGNVFWAPSGSLIYSATPEIVCDTIGEVQDYYGWNNTSMNVDPLFANANAGDLTLLPTSPVLSRGQAAAPTGMEGRQRANTIDPGAYQQTESKLMARYLNNKLYIPSMVVDVSYE